MTILRWFISKTAREAGAVQKHYRRLLQAQRDVLSTEAIAAVTVKLNDLQVAIAEGHAGKIRLRAEELQFAAEKWLKPYPAAAWRENVEVLLVALAVAMGIRTFFLQPFKIPTGSMQPTLFGINSTPDFSTAMRADNYYSQIGFSGEEKARLQTEVDKQSQVEKSLTIPNGWERLKEWFHGISYVHVVAPADGTVQVGPMTRFLIFNLKQSISIGGVEETMWFPPDYGEQSLRYRAGLFPERVYHKGEDVVKLRVSAGDHLFVDRLTYNFRRPERGEIIVFETAGIPEDMRDRYHIPADEFYIKRLVGLPGEKVQIGDDRHLIINGRRLDASTPHFENVYGFNPAQPPRESQFSGHVNGTVAEKYHLNNLSNLPEFPDQDTVFDVPADSCLPMGDNTCNSLDSRFWGAIPEDYVIGKSFFVYWPLTPRFGLDDQ
jgi:signal peptidase I